MPVRPNYVGPRRKEFAFDSQRFCDAEMLAAQSVAGRQQSFEHALLAVTRAVLGDQGVPRMRVLAQQERVHTLLRRDQPQGIRDEAGDQAPARADPV